LAAYRTRLDARVAEVRDAARRCGGSHLAVSTESDIEEMLLGQLRSEGLLQ
jgi:hypothetical protein